LVEAALALLTTAKQSGPGPLVHRYFMIATNHAGNDARDLQTLIDNFGKIKAYLARPIFYNRFWNPLTYWSTYWASHPTFNLETGAKRGAIASTVPNEGFGKYSNFAFGENITLYPNHYKMAEDDRAATLVHEASHLLLNTQDHAYRMQKRRESDVLEVTEKWRTLSRDNALNNADSYGQFARDAAESAV
jgi:hypothetical protein